MQFQLLMEIFSIANFQYRRARSTPSSTHVEGVPQPLFPSRPSASALSLSAQSPTLSTPWRICVRSKRFLWSSRNFSLSSGMPSRHSSSGARRMTSAVHYSLNVLFEVFGSFFSAQLPTQDKIEMFSSISMNPSRISQHPWKFCKMY